MKLSSELQELIASVLERPAMFWVNNVEDLNLLLLGYQMGRKEDRELSEFMYEFRVYTNKKFETNGDVHWSSIIRYHSGSDISSLNLFSKIFFDFIG